MKYILFAILPALSCIAAPQKAALPNEAQSATLQTVAELFELLRRNTNMREWNTVADFDSKLLYERNFYELGDPEERLMRRPDNYFAALYSDYYRHNATAPSTSSTQN